MVREERLHFVPQILIAAAGLVEEGGTLHQRAVERSGVMSSVTSDETRTKHYVNSGEYS